jgi:polysaccharide biosynthesis transport protein
VRTADTRAQITTAIVRIQQALAGADPDDRQEMLAQLRRLRALRAAEGNSVEVIEPARVSAVPVSPQRRNILLGLVLGALIAIGLVFLLERIDRRVREVEELEQLTGVPLLAVVPDNVMNGAESNSTNEAFQTLRASLTYFNIDRKLESVVICSSVKGEGKTTVAVNLARAVARTGKEVILLDCDLRQPMVSERMRTPGESGLGHVLSGEESIEEALSEVEVESGRLRVLASRRVPPNPSELIASERMSWLLTQVSAMSDLVVVDAPPALQVSDAVPLFRQVSGVVLIGRIDTTTRQAVRRLVSVVETSGGSALGVVATGVRAARLYGYGYGTYGATNGATTSKQPSVRR